MLRFFPFKYKLGHAATENGGGEMGSEGPRQAGGEDREGGVGFLLEQPAEPSDEPKRPKKMRNLRESHFRPGVEKRPSQPTMNLHLLGGWPSASLDGGLGEVADLKALSQ